MASQHKILIVDDDRKIAEQISDYLTGELFDTKIALDGESALQEFTASPPDLVL